MKRNLVFTLYIVFSTLLIQTVNGQDTGILEKPTANWPYLFREFQNARILYDDGDVINATINLHLLNNELQFIKDDKVFVAENIEHVEEVKLSSGFVLVHVNKDFYQLLGKNKFVLAQSFKGNINDLYETVGAYGASTSASAVKKENSVYIGGMAGSNFKTLQKDRGSGGSFSVDIKKVFIKDGIVRPASKKKLIELFPDEKSTIEKLIKKNKIKFKKEEDLLLLLQLF